MFLYCDFQPKKFIILYQFIEACLVEIIDHFNEICFLKYKING